MTIHVPYLAEEDIESDAKALLAEYANARRVTLTPPIPIENIVEKHLKLRFEFDDLHEVLGVPQVGTEPEIFGALWVDRREIYIHENLDPEVHPLTEGRYRFTLAHDDGGHWRLHRPYLATNPAQISLLSDSSEPSVICRSSQSKERVEWQADFYASCLLMPRAMIMAQWIEELGTDSPIVYERFKNTLLAKRQKRDGLRPINGFLRNVFEPEHTCLFDNVAKHFAQFFGVSVQAMRIRLEKLGLLLIEVPGQRSLAAGL